MEYNLKNILGIELYEASGVTLTIGNILIAFVLLLMSTRLSRFISNLIQNRFINKFVHDPDAQRTYSEIIYSTLLIIMVCWSLNMAGIPLTIFTVIGGALAIGIGFGSRNVVNNLISGLIMRLEKPIRTGDSVTIDHISGVVVAISTRSTRIRNSDNKIHIVPNSFFLEKMVLNSNFETTVYKNNIDFSVPYSADPKIVLAICDKVLIEETSLSKHPKPSSTLHDFADNRMVFRLNFHIDSRGFNTDEVKSRMRINIHDELKKSGVEFAVALPTQTL